MVTNLQRKLDRLDHLMSNGSDQVPHLESGSNDSWGPVAPCKRLGSTTRPPPVAALDGATSSPRGAAERRSGTNE